MFSSEETGTETFLNTAGGGLNDSKPCQLLFVPTRTEERIRFFDRGELVGHFRDDDGRVERECESLSPYFVVERSRAAVTTVDQGKWQIKSSIANSFNHSKEERVRSCGPSTSWGRSIGSNKQPKPPFHSIHRKTKTKEAPSLLYCGEVPSLTFRFSFKNKRKARQISPLLFRQRGHSSTAVNPPAATLPRPPPSPM